MMVLQNDLIKPLTAKLNEDLTLKLTEDYIMTLMAKDDVKHAPKSKRVTKNASNTVYQVRNFPGTLEVVKIPNNYRLYLYGKSLVIYLLAHPIEPEYDEPADAVDMSIKTSVHEAGAAATDVITVSESDITSKGLLNPETELGFRFKCTAIAVGSIVNKLIVPILPSDKQLCLDMNICTKVADKIQRFDTNLHIQPAVQSTQSTIQRKHSYQQAAGEQKGICKRPRML